MDGKSRGDGNGESGSTALIGIHYPGQNDVKFGRGGDTNYHSGNARFRHFVASYKPRYQTASKGERQVVVHEIVNAWRSQDPPGRFLARSDSRTSERATWHDVGDEMALKKTAKVLGEGLGTKRKQCDQSQSQKESGGTSSPRASTLTSAAAIIDSTGGSDGVDLAFASLAGRGRSSLALQTPMQTSSGSQARRTGATLLPPSNSADRVPALGNYNLQEAALTTALQNTFSVPNQLTTKTGGTQSLNPVGLSSPSQLTSQPQVGPDFLPVAASLTDVFSSSTSSSDSEDRMPSRNSRMW